MAYPFQKTQETIKTLEELRQIYVGSERDEWFQQHLNRNINGDPMGQGAAKPVAYTAGGESRGVLVLDGPGGGKTSLIHKALREHPDLQPMNEAHRPWLGVSHPPHPHSGPLSKAQRRSGTVPALYQVARNVSSAWSERLNHDETSG
jgi:hypothetical protein